MTASPAAGSTFAGWSGACSGTGTCAVSMTAARSVTATFNTSTAARGTFGNSGSPWAIAASGTTRIQAENFDTGGEGVAYHDTDAANSGGQYRPSEGVDIETTTDAGGGSNVGWVNGGEWLEYTVNVAAGGNLQPQTAAGAAALRHLDGDGPLRRHRQDGQPRGSFNRRLADVDGLVQDGRQPFGRAAVHAHRDDRRELQPQLDRDHGGDAHEPDVDGARRPAPAAAPSPPRPPGINCGSDCSESYASGTNVTLTASAATGSTFAGWSGACSGTAGCAVAMTAARSVTATFSATTPVATIYGDALATDWASWSWSATIDFNGTSPVRVGTRAINVTYQGWGGLSLRKGTAQSTSGYAALKFWVHGGTGAAKSLRVYTQTADGGGESTSVVVSAPRTPGPRSPFR